MHQATCTVPSRLDPPPCHQPLKHGHPSSSLLPLLWLCSCLEHQVIFSGPLTLSKLHRPDQHADAKAFERTHCINWVMESHCEAASHTLQVSIVSGTLSTHHHSRMSRRCSLPVSLIGDCISKIRACQSAHGAIMPIQGLLHDTMIPADAIHVHHFQILGVGRG